MPITTAPLLGPLALEVAFTVIELYVFPAPRVLLALTVIGVAPLPGRPLTTVWQNGFVLVTEQETGVAVPALGAKEMVVLPVTLELPASLALIVI